MVATAALSPDSKTLVTGGDGNCVRFFYLQSAKEVTRPGGHLGVVVSVHLTPDGKEVLTQSEDGTLRRWRLAGGQALGPVPLPPGAAGAVLSDDGAVVAVQGKDQVLNVRDRTSGRARGQIPAPAQQRVFGLAFAPDGGSLAVFWYPDRRITLHDLSGRQTGAVATQGILTTTFDTVSPGDGPRPVLFFSADSKRLAV
jgi:WD40 repeat protein